MTPLLFLTLLAPAGPLTDGVLMGCACAGVGDNAAGLVAYLDSREEESHRGAGQGTTLRIDH